MNQLFYNIASGIVHQIRREKPTTISEVIVRGKRNIKQNFRCFSLFLPHLRTLTQEKRSQKCLRFGTGGPSLCLYPLFPALTMAARAKKKIFRRSDLLTLSACTIGILSTLTYIEFDCAALLAIL